MIHFTVSDCTGAHEMHDASMGHSTVMTVARTADFACEQALKPQFFLIFGGRGTFPFFFDPISESTSTVCPCDALKFRYCKL